MPNNMLRTNKLLTSSRAVKSRKLLGIPIWKNINRVNVVAQSRGRFEVFNTQGKQCYMSCSRQRTGTLAYLVELQQGLLLNSLNQLLQLMSSNLLSVGLVIDGTKCAATWAVVSHAAESTVDDLTEYAVVILIANIIEYDVEGLATNVTGYTVRGLTHAEECALGTNTTDQTE